MESGYDTPVHTQTNSQGVLQSGYDIPIDAQRLPIGKDDNTPVDALAVPTQMKSTKVQNVDAVAGSGCRHITLY